MGPWRAITAGGELYLVVMNQGIGPWANGMPCYSAFGHAAWLPCSTQGEPLGYIIVPRHVKACPSTPLVFSICNEASSTGSSPWVRGGKLR